jgi:mono/diheme cytochrome c family protein
MLGNGPSPLPGLFFALLFTAGAFAQTPASSQALLSRYCYTCHNEKLQTAGVALDGLRATAVGSGAELWERVLRKVRTGEMPPPGALQPEPPQARAFAAWLEGELDGAAEARPNPGRPAVQRLNRAEYSNAIRDLLGLDLDPGASLPADDSGYGFDNIGDVLSTSPLLLEKYLAVARRVSRLAVGNIAVRPAAEKYGIERNVPQSDRMSDELPFGSRGGIVVRHHFPVDAEYSLRVHVRSGATRSPYPKLDFRLDRARVHLADVAVSPLEENEESRFYEVRLPVRAGTREVGITFLQEYWKSEGGEEPGRPLPRPNFDYLLIGGPFDPKGLGDTESRRRIFTCRPAPNASEIPCARLILGTLARRAYRRPVTEADLRPLLRLFTEGRREGGNFEAGIEMALRGILVSPNFLFRIERDPPKSAPGTVYRLGDVELASRLSFFLWSSLPDEELLSLAEQGKLRTPGELERQVRRMLADPKARALVTNFAGQWLHLRNLAEARPDPDRFPDFDESLRQAFRRETEMLFEAVVREDRSVLELLDTDFTFVNDRLAKHYEMPAVRGSYFRRVPVGSAERGGLLTHGSILTVTSYPTRTSPVIRGKWILENLFASPPPPPPPDVPELEESKAAAPASLREQLEKHRSAAACASCHARLDPLGFALENYDAVGKWRSQDGETEIDASATLPDGTALRGPRELKQALLARRDEFVECVSEKLMTYALGRGLEYYDRPAVRRIARETARRDYRFSALILAITGSTPFEKRRTPDP